MPPSSMAETIPVEKLSHIDREIFTMSPRNLTSEACGLNTIDLFREDQWLNLRDAQLIDEQCSWVGFPEYKTFWEVSKSPPGTIELCDTPISLLAIPAALGGCPTNNQSCHDAPNFVYMSRTSSESSETWERGLNISSMPDSINQYRQAGDQRYACSECDHQLDSTDGRASHAKRISKTVWTCSEPECGKSYSRRDTFLRHQNAHKVDSHPCKICLREKKQKSFKRKDHLKEHVRKCHSGRGENDIWSFRNSVQRKESDHSDSAVDVGMGSLQQQAVEILVDTLGNVLENHDPKLDFGDFRRKLNALSDSDMKSVVGSMASVGATMAQTILSATCGLDHSVPERGSAL